jgi:ribosomal protein S12 methylthiotransferase accessory factor
MRMVAFAEGVERYAQLSLRPDLRSTPYSAVRDLAVDPRSLALYLEEQYRLPGFPRPRYSPELPLNWSFGYGLRDGHARLVPYEVATFVAGDLMYPGRLVDERLSSGGAVHRTAHRALVNAIRELVERDQFMIAWYKRVPLPRVEIDGPVGDPYAGVDLTILDLRLDLRIPSFLTIGRNRDERGNLAAGALMFAATADLDPKAAVSRGLMEMMLNYETVALHPHPEKDFRNNPYDPEDPAQGWRAWWPTYMFYLNPASAHFARWLFDAPSTVKLSDIPSLAKSDARQDLAECLDALAAAGLQPYAIDLESDEFADTGLRAVKVVVPGMVPLTPGKQSRRLACPRVDDAARRTGRPCLGPGETSPDPHPNV